MNKYCRICWNTNQWKAPTGEAAKLESKGAYVVTHGFGAEEWLFNFSWLQPGPNGSIGKFRYGFLQPIGKYREKYQGQSFDVFLYTIRPDGERMAVGIIRELFVPLEGELAAAHRYMRAKGWIEEMRQDLSEVRASFVDWDGDPANVINVRFKQSDVELFDQYLLPDNNIASRFGRYQPLNWTGAAPPARIVKARPPSKKDGKRRSEQERIRAAVKGTVYSPQHVILQNALFDSLCERFGRAAVSYEQDYIDLQLRRGKVLTLFEIKIAPTAKSCIRQALGQLLEYDLYPDRTGSSQLVIVGEQPAKPADKTYLRHLQKKFGIPISYQRWDWEKSTLEDDA
jgi:hypothetical protein